jgi:integrase
MSKATRLNSLRENPRLTGESKDLLLEALDMKRKESTQVIYLRSFVAFLEKNKLDSESFYELACNTAEEKRRGKKKIAKMVRDFENYEIENGKATSTTKHIEKVVKIFYDANAIENFSMFDLELKVTNGRGQERASIEHIKQFMESTHSLRNKSMFSMAKDSGLRSGDICSLNWGAFKEPILDPSMQWFTWEVSQGKAKKDSIWYANPVIGIDALEYLRKYHRYCESRGLPVGDNDPIYICLSNRWNVTVDNRLNPQSVSAEVYKVRKRAGLHGEKLSMHSMRKNHQTSLEKAGVPSNWIYQMQGRSIMNSSSAYTRPDRDELIEEYKKGYYYLSFDQLIREESSRRDKEKVSDLQDELNEMREAVALLNSSIPTISIPSVTFKTVIDDEVNDQIADKQRNSPDYDPELLNMLLSDPSMKAKLSDIMAEIGGTL